MVKFLKPGKVVIVLAGRFAGKKAVIVKNFDEGTNGKPYGCALVVGLSKVPRKVTKKQSEAAQAKRSRVKTFIKMVNYNHLMPTRYTLDADFKTSIPADVLDNATKKAEVRKEAKQVMEEKFKTGKNRWFFSKLRF